MRKKNNKHNALQTKLEPIKTFKKSPINPQNQNINKTKFMQLNMFLIELLFWPNDM
jgi:hypothetical protein